MSELRLGDILDDYCVKCRRLTNHAIVSLVNGEVAKVRCRSCYFDHDYLREQAPPSKKDLKKAELFNAVLSTIDPSTTPSEGPSEPAPADVTAAEVTAAEATAAEATAGDGDKAAAKKARGRAKKA